MGSFLEKIKINLKPQTVGQDGSSLLTFQFSFLSSFKEIISIFLALIPRSLPVLEVTHTAKGEYWRKTGIMCIYLRNPIVERTDCYFSACLNKTQVIKCPLLKESPGT